VRTWRFYDAAAANPDVFRVLTRERPDLWEAVVPIARERERAKLGRLYPVVPALRAAVVWPIRIVTWPFRSYL
jgi:hypothetical protein